MNKMKSQLPGSRLEPVNSEAYNFITGAEKRTTKNEKVKKAVSYAWEEPGVREDVIKVYNLRLSEPYLLKLKYIAEHTPDSMQKFCLDVVVKAIDEKIEELIK